MAQDAKVLKQWLGITIASFVYIRKRTAGFFMETGKSLPVVLCMALLFLVTHKDKITGEKVFWQA